MHKRLLIVVLLLPLALHAADEAEPAGGGWSGEGELGFTSTSGNTESENLNASLGISKEVDRWKHAASIKLIRNKTEGELSADSQVFKERSEYSLGEKTYVFGQLRYEEDEFSGYSTQSSVAAGIGSRLLENERHMLDGSIGLGYRRLEASDSGDTEEEGVVDLDLKYAFKISETATFTEAIFVESGDTNTYSESETALRTQIDESLAAKISYLVKRNSDVPAGTDKSDEILSVSLVYGF